MTHLEQVKPEDFNRFERLNVFAHIQVAGNFTKLSSRGDIESFVGKDRAYNFIPLRSIYDAHAHVTLSSDRDVSTPNSFTGIQNAISRGYQSVKVKDAVEMYTINAAYAMRQEQMDGPLATEKDVIHKTRVLKTVLDGEEIYWVEDQNLVDECYMPNSVRQLLLWKLFL